MDFNLYDLINPENIHSSGIAAVNIKWRNSLPSWVSEAEECENAFEELRHSFISCCYDLAISFGYDGSDTIGRSGGWVAPFWNHSNIQYVTVPLFDNKQISIYEQGKLRVFSEYALLVEMLFTHVRNSVINSVTVSQISNLAEEIKSL